MKYNTYTLPNGLRIIHRPVISDVVYCGYAINAGSRQDPENKDGMAHFCEHVSFKGTGHRSSIQILNSLERVGGELNAYTGKENTVYHAAILKEHLPRAIDILTDIVFHSTYPQNEIDKEVEVICDEIESYNDAPEDLIFDDFENVIYKGHPLGHSILGQAEQLRTYTTADAVAFTKKYYRPENAVFFISGDIDFDKAAKLLGKATSDFGSCQPIMQQNGNNNLPEYVPQEITVNKKTHQAHVIIGTRAYGIQNENHMPLYLLNDILGGSSMNSRLNVALRERNGLVYSVESFKENYSDIGLWGIYFACTEHDIKRCLKLARKEMDKLMQKPLTTQQLNAAKKQIKGHIGVAFDSNENFALEFGKSYLHYGWKKDMASLCKKTDEVTSEQMQQVAEELFKQENMTIMIFE